MGRIYNQIAKKCLVVDAVRRLTALLLILLLSCTGHAMADTAQAGLPRLTLMIYMTGSNLESDGGAASAELEEMSAAYAGAKGVDVLVMASGSKQWHANVDAGETSIYALQPDGLKKEFPGPLRSMGEADTLLSLLTYGYEHHPAETYALILWDHGAGPMMGVCFDELFPGEYGMDSLSLEELAAALSQSPFAEKKLAWIGFDACLMASVETAAAVAPYADYMIASQDTEPVSGWDYSFLRHAGTDTSAVETGRRIIDGYFSSVGETMSTITLSMVDLSAIPAVASEMDALFGGMSGHVNAEQYPTLTSCRINAKEIANTSPSDYDLVDLGDLLETYEAAGVASCGDLLEKLLQAVILHRENVEFMNGLSVYYPYYNKETYLAAWEEHTAVETFAPGYGTFLRQVSQIWLGDALADWDTGLNMEVTQETDRRVVSMQLTPEQAAQYASGRLYVLEQVYPDEYRFIYMTDDVTLTSAHQLESVYEGKALFMTDAQGNPLTDALTYLVRDDMLFVVGMLESDYADGMLEYLPVYLVYRQNGQGEYTLIEVLEVTGEPVLLGKSTIRLSDWNAIAFLGYAYQPTYDETGALLPYSSWTYTESLTMEWFSLDTPDWHPVFLDLYSDSQRIALLQIRDNQQNAVYNGLVPLDNPNLTSLHTGERTLMDEATCRMTLTDAELIGGMNPGMRLLLRCENLSDQKLRLCFDQFAADKTLLDCTFPVSYLDPNDTELIALTVPAEYVQRAHLARVETFDLWVAYEWADAEGDTEQPSRESRIHFSLPVDFTSVLTVEEPREPLAAACWEGVDMAIDDLQWNEAGHLAGVLRMTNTGDSETKLNVQNAYINDICCYMKRPYGDIHLPGGYTAYRTFELYAEDNDGLVWPGFASHPLSLLGIRHITSLGMDFYHDSTLNDERVVFSLRQALDYPLEESPASWPTLYDVDGVFVSLIGSDTHPDSLLDRDKRFFYFCICNTTDRELILGYRTAFSVALDGRKMEDYGADVSSVPSHTTTCVTLSVGVGDGEAAKAFAIADLQMGLYDYGGRGDTLVLHLETLRDPEIVETELPSSTIVRYIYTADAFQIAAQSRPSLYSQLVRQHMMGNAENMRVLMDQDDARISLDGFCLFPTDPSGAHGGSLYLHIRPPQGKDFRADILHVISNEDSGSYQILPPSFLSLIPTGSFAEKDALVEVRFTTNHVVSPDTWEPIQLVLSIDIGNDSYRLTVSVSTDDCTPVYLEQVSDDWPFPCYVYRPDAAPTLTP